ncbi:radical SAM protein [Candidatus Bathyarchaeota archaeon]|nr:radical SAM protein [Candidatus Bathyarchaeota archaeon]
MTIIAPFDPWKGPLCTCPPKYSFSAYTGCSHACLYCYISSYIPRPFKCRAKNKPIERLLRELRRVNPELHISIANSSDPYPPVEAKLELTRKALRELLPRGYRVQLITKSDLVVRDLDLIQNGNCSVSITVTTLDDKLASKLEPLAPPPKRRIKALETLTRSGVPCSARIDPIIPGINDKDIDKLVKSLAKAGVSHVVSSTYKAKSDSFERLMKAYPKLRDRLYRLYWTEGMRVGRSRLLPRKVRYDLLKSVKELVEENGMTFATCREGFPTLQSGETCDGSHLIPNRRIQPKLSLF